MATIKGTIEAISVSNEKGVQKMIEKGGDCVMPREGIFAKVLEGGFIRVGEVIEVRND